ncbi:MAG: hypothetical protein V8T86_01910 [Victivallis sp.]
MVQSAVTATGLTAEAGGTIMMGERTRLNTVFLTGGTMQVLGAVAIRAGGLPLHRRLRLCRRHGHRHDRQPRGDCRCVPDAGRFGATPAFGSYKLAGNAADFHRNGARPPPSFWETSSGTERVQYAGRCGRKTLRSRPQCRRRTRADGVAGAYAHPADWGSATIVSLLSTGADVSSLADHGGFIADGNVSVVCDASYAGKVLHGGPGTGDPPETSGSS